MPVLAFHAPHSSLNRYNSVNHQCERRYTYVFTELCAKTSSKYILTIWAHMPGLLLMDTPWISPLYIVCSLRQDNLWKCELSPCVHLALQSHTCHPTRQSPPFIWRLSAAQQAAIAVHSSMQGHDSIDQKHLQNQHAGDKSSWANHDGHRDWSRWSQRHI